MAIVRETKIMVRETERRLSFRRLSITFCVLVCERERERDKVCFGDKRNMSEERGYLGTWVN